MASHREYEEKTEKLLEPIASQFGVWIYDVEFVKEAGTFYLRAYIEKDGGVNIDDCVDVSHALSDKLDETDFIAEEYILEVSSPGLGRQLKKDRHLENSLGMDVDIKLYEAIDGQKEYTGELVSYDKDSLVINIDGSELRFERNKVANIRLTLDI